MDTTKSSGPWNATKSLIWVEARLRPLLARPFVLRSFGAMRRAVERLGFADLTVKRDGYRITGGISDRNMLASVEAGTFEPLSLDLWESLIKPDMNVVDVGAHIGIFTLTAAARVGPRGKVWAIEPNPTSFRLLNRNIRANALANVIVLEAALSDSNGESTLHVRPGDRMQSSLVAVEAGSELDVSVRISRLDDLIGSEIAVHVLKVDAEGSEPAILRGMNRLLPDVHAIIVESNSNCLRQAGSSPEELHTMLADAGFEISVVDEESKSLIPWSDWTFERNSVNLLAIRAAES